MATSMIRVLVLITITGFLVGVVSLSVAAGLGGPELAARGWSWGPHDWWDRHDRDRPWDHGDWSERHHGGGGTATRELAWDGSTELEVDIPADVEFTQGTGPGTVSITGPRSAVENVTLNGGRLSLDGRDFRHRRLRVVITAPNVSKFTVNGADRLDIRNYKQDRLIVNAHGSSEVSVQGEARAVELDLSGSVEADLGGLSVDEAVVDISGSGEATIAPKLSADLEVSGSSEVVLLTRPAQVNTDVGGSGEITYQDGGDVVDTAPAPPVSDNEPRKAL